MKQHMSAYTAQDQLVWKTLFERQFTNLQGKVSNAYLDALQAMSSIMNAHKIPDFREIDTWFSTRTGWKMEVVPGLIPVDEFFRLLAEKRFCSSTWLRSMEQLDYLEEPDMFHDTFGHVPLLANPVFSDFMQTFGELGCHVMNDPEKLAALQRLYWFTIEFGMIAGEQPLIYGAGIISSFGETNRAVSKAVEHKSFILEEVLEMPFRTDVVQEHYVCIPHFEQLFESIQQLTEQWTTLTVTGN
ncbi:MAG: phenylalanine-4-hydroxylase [Fluviicola sp.]|nr:phenylalanine-4-hydroxylase [Fluviicola sp.]